MKFFYRLRLLLQTFWLLVQFTTKSNTGKYTGPTVYAILTDARCAKYMVTLLMFFLLAGYKICLFPNLKFMASLLPYKKLLFQFPNLTLSFHRPQHYDYHLASSVKDKIKQGKFLTLSYQYFDASENSLIVPYPMSPQHYTPSLSKTLQELRTNTKTIGVFFSGNQHPELYSNPIISVKFKKTNRIQLLNYLKKNMPKGEIEIVQQGIPHQNDFLKKFVLVDWKWSPAHFENEKARIADTLWLKHLSTCHFFLACPGMTMPMCHNIIEAMSVGAIPITQYAEEFYPPLMDGVNCLTFHSGEDAQGKIRYALRLPDEAIATMRKAVIDYYEQHLSPASFMRKIENDNSKENTITMNAEQLSVL